MTAARGADAVAVREVEGRADADAFVRLPWRIYRDDPAWVPPLLAERKEFIDPRKHPFHRHGAAARFLARRGREVVGRVLASDDPNFNAAHGTSLGCFGMFESLPERDVAHALLDRAAAWLAGRGRSHILGPVDYSTNYPLGLLVEGFGTPPSILMNHNPPYYAGLLESWGLAKAKDLYAWRVDRDPGPPERFVRIAERAARRNRVRARPVDLSRFDPELATLRHLYNRAWAGNWGFVPMTEAEFEHLGRDLRRLVIPDLLMIAEIDGQPAGFCLSLPDLNEVLPRLNGRLLPFGFLRLLHALRARRIRGVRMLTLGVLPEHRRRGIAELLIVRTFEACAKHGFDHCHMGWTLEDNEAINHPIERLGSTRPKRYRLYERKL